MIINIYSLSGSVLSDSYLVEALTNLGLQEALGFEGEDLWLWLRWRCWLRTSDDGDFICGGWREWRKGREGWRGNISEGEGRRRYSESPAGVDDRWRRLTEPHTETLLVLRLLDLGHQQPLRPKCDLSWLVELFQGIILLKGDFGSSLHQHDGGDFTKNWEEGPDILQVDLTSNQQFGDGLTATGFTRGEKCFQHSGRVWSLLWECESNLALKRLWVFSAGLCYYYITAQVTTWWTLKLNLFVCLVHIMVGTDKSKEWSVCVQRNINKVVITSLYLIRK